jgi:hypothetical protein
MTQTLTTERLREILERRSPSLRWGEAEKIAAELLANREAPPVADEIYAELYRLRIENKGPNGFETWRDAAVFERTRRADAERKLNGEEMTYLEAMSLLTTDDAKNLSAIEAFRRGASYNGKINAHALRNSIRYQYLRDKDAFGAENEPGLVEWDELIELDGNEFDAAIDARMTHSDIAYTAPPAPAVPDEKAITPFFDTLALDTAKMVMCDVNRRSDFLGGDTQLLARIQCRVDDACRAAMLAQPVSRVYKLVPVELTPEMQAAWDGAPNNSDDDTVNMMNAYRAMIAAAPEGNQDEIPKR